MCLRTILESGKHYITSYFPTISDTGQKNDNILVASRVSPRCNWTNNAVCRNWAVAVKEHKGEIKPDVMPMSWTRSDMRVRTIMKTTNSWSLSLPGELFLTNKGGMPMSRVHSLSRSLSLYSKSQ